ncbi:hypothetical protein NW767_010795 [Fusarium falciforme]|uniref:ABM domain-containing protein n=1 Tax=Fusarium falciforme TaxID=195108 RepID=A0A9W8R596_9HYPO|nr:hypothetical protein NW755_007872 [Fusarium falciforme]KAJ4191888.1 hypothetical protein NW767_010795 [Fusarium falciforme]
MATNTSGEREKARPDFKNLPGASIKFLEEVHNNTHAITIINIFVLKSHEDIDLWMENRKRDSKFMKQQYGMLSAQLHRGVGKDSNTFVNLVQWESTEAFRNAFLNPEFQKHISQFPSETTIFPLLLKRIGVPGTCVA